MKATVKTLDAKSAGEVDLNDAIFGLEPRTDLIQRYVVNSDPVRKEAPFLEHAIAGTRQAWGLTGGDERVDARLEALEHRIRNRRARQEDGAQWRKCLSPVKTMAMACSSAAVRASSTPGQHTTSR